MKNLLLIISIIATAGLPADATVILNDGAIHNVSYVINDDVIVNDQPPNLQTTINLSVGGSVRRLFAQDHTAVLLSGGSVPYLAAYDTSHVTIINGSIGQLYAWGDNDIVMSGGSVSQLDIFGSSALTLSGGYAYGITGGANSNLSIIGGSMSGLGVFVNSQTILRGGIVYEYIGVGDNGRLVIDGSNFALGGNPIGFGLINSILGNDYISEPYRQLTGTLANGDILNVPFQIGNNGSIILVPEPATMVLLGLGFFALCKRRA